MKWLLVLMTAFALTASAADIGGTWKATMETPNGSMENTFVFKADGANLTGTISNEFMGELPISEGKVDGDSVSFVGTISGDGNEFKLMYKGKADGKEMKLTITLPGGDRTFDMTAKKTS